MRTATARSTRWSTRATVGFLAAVMLVSLGAHVWGLGRDLPMPDVDERYFVPPAAYIAASGDPNPHWFGHPGSTANGCSGTLPTLVSDASHGGNVFGVISASYTDRGGPGGVRRGGGQATRDNPTLEGPRWTSRHVRASAAARRSTRSGWRFCRRLGSASPAAGPTAATSSRSSRG